MSVATVASEPSSRERILDAAEQLFSRRGYSGVGLREVADAVGLGKSSLFHHFRNKPELYAAVTARILARMDECVAGAVAAGGTALERLERVLDEMVDQLARHRHDARVLLRALFEDDDLPGDTEEERRGREAIGRILERITALLREGASSGRLRAVHVPHFLLTLIGQVVFPFASGEFGEEVLGRDLFDPTEVARRKREMRDLLRFGLLAGAPGRPAGED